MLPLFLITAILAQDEWTARTYVRPGDWEPSTEGFSLARPVRIQIIDPRNRGIRGARVAATWLSGFPERYHGNPNWIFRNTDDDGLVIFEGLPATGVLLQVDAAGWARTERLRVDPSTSSERLVRVVLAPAAPLAGRLLDPHGHPASGKSVSVRPGVREIPHGLQRSWTESVTTDADGRFVLERVPPGRYLLGAADPPPGSPRAEFVVIAPNEALELVLPRTSPVGDVTIEPSPELRDRTRALSVQFLGVRWPGPAINVEGAELRTTLPVGDYRLDGTAWLREPRTMFHWSGRLEVATGQRARWTFSPPRGGATLEGTVRRADGSAPERLSVNARREGAPVRELFVPEDDVFVETRDTGRFRLDGLKRGATYRIFVDAWPDVFLKTTAVAGGRPLELRLDAKKEIRLRARDDRGRQLGTVEIDALPRKADERGVFTLDLPGSARRSLTVWSRTGEGGRRIALPERGGTIDLGDVVLEPSRTLEGTVIDARTGTPISQALIEPLGDEAPLDDRTYELLFTAYFYGQDVPGSVRSDEHGHFAVATCRSIPVRVSAPGLLAKDLPGDHPGGTITLEAAPAVNVTVARKWAPTCIEVDGSAWIDQISMAPVLTDSEGRARITELQPGILHLRRGCQGMAGPWLTVDVRSGETLTLELP